jgi:uncharacterized protein YjbJ (UPF0337 family)
MNKDQPKGRIAEAKGKAKEVVGKVLGDDDLARRGKIQKNLGKAQAEYGDLRESIKKTDE